MNGATAATIARRVRADAAASHITQVFERHVFRWRKPGFVPFNNQPRVLTIKMTKNIKHKKSTNKKGGVNKIKIKQSGHLFRIDVVGGSDNSVQTFINYGKDTALYIHTFPYEILDLFNSFVV
jgi:hypothetical protein